MAADFRHISTRINDRVGRIVLKRPPLNILNIAMMREISSCLNEWMFEHDMVAIVFEASPGSRAFSAGVAVEEHVKETIYQMLESFHAIFRMLQQVAKPTIAVVDGAALGGGCELVAGCDIVVASEESRFGQPEIKLGVFPPIAAVLLPQIIGDKKARELILTGELMDASQALKLGLVNYVVPSSKLVEKTDEILFKLRDLSGASLEWTKRAFEAARGRPFEEAVTRVEDLYLNDLMKTRDAHEGVKAFIEKRKPAWRNR